MAFQVSKTSIVTIDPVIVSASLGIVLVTGHNLQMALKCRKMESPFDEVSLLSQCDVLRRCQLQNAP
jgi:hypothetical protein